MADRCLRHSRGTVAAAELGEAQVHNVKTGTAHFVYEDDDQALDI